MLSASATRPSHPTSCRHFTTRIKQRCPKTTSSAHARRSCDAATSRRRRPLADFQIEALQMGAGPPNRGAEKGDGLKMDGLDGAHSLEPAKGGRSRGLSWQHGWQHAGCSRPATATGGRRYA
eukprot:scaffold23192_cov118-Isochrysis_galbana.AAC.1